MEGKFTKFVTLDIAFYFYCHLSSGGSKTTRLEGRNLLFYFVRNGRLGAGPIFVFNKISRGYQRIKTRESNSIFPRDNVQVADRAYTSLN